MRKLWQLLGIVTFWASWPALWVYLHGTTRTRVVIVSRDKKVLLVKGWLGSGKWILPGGGMHKGEKPLLAAIREVREETGLELDPVTFKSLGAVDAKEHGLKYTAEIFVVDLDEEPVLKGRKLEVIDIAWVPKGEFKDLSPLTEQLLSNWS